MTQHPYKPHRKLRKFREQNLGITQAEFGESVGMLPGAVCAIENGAERLGVARAMRICERYTKPLLKAGVSFEALIRAQQ